jgi:hypothetical protein
MSGVALLASPNAIRQFKGLPVTAVKARFRRGEEAVHFDDLAVIPLTLVFEHLPEGAVCRITEALGQLGFHKAAKVQVFDAEGVVTTDQLDRKLMQSAIPAVASFRAGNCQPPPGLRAIPAALPTAGDAPVEAFDLAFSLSVESRRGDLLAVVESRERFESNVNAGRRRASWWALFPFKVTDEGDMPVSVSRLLDGRALEGPFHLAMEMDLHEADLGNVNGPVNDRHVLGDAKGVGRSFPTLALRKTRSLRKEVDEGAIQVPQHLLQHLAMTAGQEGSIRLLFQGHQFGPEILMGESLARGLVGFLLPSQRPVPDEATTARELAEDPLLLGSGVQLESVALLELHHL